ncbi:MAG TPA: MGMT family protein [Candidatus Acidoferrales bacterium]|nr:MGMT family protein [Candidatus Acidoferrales bacterium]
MSWAPVYRWVRLIPRGRVVTYGQVGRALRLPGGGRTAGRAMAACPPGVPWHRVIGAGGHLRTPEPYCSYQRQLLTREGVAFIGNRVDLANHAWKPGRAPKAPKSRPHRGV